MDELIAFYNYKYEEDGHYKFQNKEVAPVELFTEDKIWSIEIYHERFSLHEIGTNMCIVGKNTDLIRNEMVAKKIFDIFKEKGFRTIIKAFNFTTSVERVIKKQVGIEG